MKTAIIIFPGSNCDNETERVLFKCTGIAPIRVWHKETKLPNVDMYVLPGGLSYGDYLRAGALANLSPIVKELKKTDRKILGICNGFQILCEAGLLPGTLRINSTEKFICKPMDIITWPVHNQRRIPIAHAEGNYYHPNPAKLVEEQKVAYTYYGYENNPNGSTRGICGIRNNNVLGMMPHPERAFESYHCSQDGFKILEDFNA